MEFKLNGRIWIDAPDGPFLGAGKIELLEKIKALGSIRQAAMVMKMSYRQAWQMVESMNQKSSAPLIISQRGGKGGGKALLTEKGEKALTTFVDLKSKFQEFLEKHSQTLEL